MGGIFHHALTAKFVNGFRCGADKHLEKFVVAVIGVIGHFDFRSVFRQRADILYGCAQLILKIAANFACPAHIKRALLRVEHDAGFFAFKAVRVSERLDIEIFQPRAQRLFDLLQAHALAQKN